MMVISKEEAMIEMTMERRRGCTVERRHRRTLRVAHALSTLRCSIVRGGSTLVYVTPEFVVTTATPSDITFTVVYTGSEAEMAVLVTALATRAIEAPTALAA